MRIGLLTPSVYMSLKKYQDMIFAPRDLATSLADGLVRRGHDVYFFTTSDTKTNANIIPGDESLILNDYIEEKIKSDNNERFKWASFYSRKRNYEMDLTERCYKMAIEGKIDIIHSYHDTLAHYFNDLTGFPAVYTLHDPLPTKENSINFWLLQKYSHHNYVSISNSFRRSKNLHLNFVDTVYHGIDVGKYQGLFNKGSYIAFIGRMVPEKGVDSAIETAKLVNIPIKIATSSLSQNKNLSYYKNDVEHLLNNPLVSTIGFMEGYKKHEFLADASCLLFPIHWEEPFGLVMIETMACGTPVIAYNRGSVPEIVRDGITGFVIDPPSGEASPDGEDRPGRGSWVIKKQGIEGLVEAVQRIGEIDRSACRKHVKENFSVEKMVENYEKVYQKILTSPSLTW